MLVRQTYRTSARQSASSTPFLACPVERSNRRCRYLAGFESVNRGDGDPAFSHGSRMGKGVEWLASSGHIERG